MTPERLAEIKARLAKATPGPWVYNACSDKAPVCRVGATWRSLERCEGLVVGSSEWTTLRRCNGEFIASSWQDVTDLLVEVARLRTLADDLDEYS